MLIADVGVSFALVVFPNILLAISFLRDIRLPVERNASDITYLLVALAALQWSDFLLWALANLCLLVILCALQRHVFSPMLGIIRQLYNMRSVLQEGGHPASSIMSMRAVAVDITRIAQLAHDYYVKQQETAFALKQARGLLSQIAAQQAALVTTTSREMMAQHQSVLTYANYLEEQIAQHAIDPGLRYDFDEVSESSFNLKLIAGALNLVEHASAQNITRLDVPRLLQQTVLALAPSLDRRNMRLTTAEVDLGVTALSDPAIIAHVLWMMLLGTVRYAADESTLRMRCLYTHDRRRVLISIVVSELSPGRLSAEERRAFFGSQVRLQTPHLFAETIHTHGNIQLTSMLMAGLDGDLSVSPLTSHSCEICLSLPAAPAVSPGKEQI